MNKKKKMRMLIAELILLVIAIIAIVIWISNEKKEILIYDYARTIEYDEMENYALTEADIAEAYIMQADMKDDYITEKDQILGMYITRDTSKGSHIMKSQLSKDPTAIVDSGVSELADYRKIYLPINYGNAFAGDIAAGDRVDLMFQETGGGMPVDEVAGLAGASTGVNYYSSRIFMQNIPVFQVYDASGAVYTRRETDPVTLNKFNGELSTDGTTEQAYGAPAYVALTVTAQQYEEISTRLQSGTISMVCRFDESQDVETNGYLVIKGTGANTYAGEGSLEYDPQLVEETADENATAEINVTRPALYTFIRDLSKVDMTDEQRQTWNNLWTRYSDLMKFTNGEEWESNSPEMTSIDDMTISIGDNVDYQRLLDAFKTDLETFAKELRGETVLLPW